VAHGSRLRLINYCCPPRGLPRAARGDWTAKQRDAALGARLLVWPATANCGCNPHGAVEDARLAPSARSLDPAARGVQGAAEQLKAEQSARLEVRLCT